MCRPVIYVVMLFYAIGQTTLTPDRAEKGVSYRCPECGGEVRLRGGVRRQKHFYHLSSKIHCRKNGKSPTHLAIQNLLHATLDSAKMEHPFPEIGRIADLYLPKRELVIEVQCSSISREEIEGRNRDYKAIGLTTLWLFHTRLFSPHQLHYPFPHFFTDLDARGRGAIFDVWEKKRYPVNLGKEVEAKGKLPPFLQLRFLRWQRAFEGDLVHRAICKEIAFPLPRFNYLFFFHALLKKFTS